MRAALIIAGQPRTFEFCYPSLKRHILDVYQPDVFISTDSHRDRLTELYKPVGISVVEQEHLYNLAIEQRKSLPSAMAVNDLCVTWKVNTAMQMKTEHEQANGFFYDVVIRTRFDVKFKSVPEIKAQENTLHVPTVGGYWTTPPADPGIHWGGYSSHICWSTSEIMNGMASMYFDEKDYLTLAVNSGVPFGWAPEYVLKYYCDVNNINVQFENIDMMLIRGTSENPLSFDNRRISEFAEYA